MPNAQVQLPGDASSVPTARRFVESLLTAWGHPEAGWAAALCISELAANCTLHARTDFSVSVRLEDDVVRLEVSDGSPGLPAVRSYGAESTTGRGLRLLEEYANGWGVDTRPGGKTVWVVLDVAAGTDPRQADDEETSLEALLMAFPDDEPTGTTAFGLRWQVAA